MSISPTVEGFRAAFRRPALTLAEITWRWTTGATAAALLIFGLFEYLGTLQVTNGELLFLRTRHPYLVGEAIAHILRGSLNRAVLAALVAALMVTALWIVAASVGRIATVRALLDYFRRDAPSNASPTESSLPALLRLNFLRAALALAAVLGFVGAGIAAGFVSPVAHPAPGAAFSLFLLLAGMICYLWSAFNWLLSLASVFAVRDGLDAGGAIAAAVDFCREHFRAVFAVSTWAGLAHLAALVGASTLVAMPLGFAGILPWRLIVAGIIIATLGYFALADWLYMARLAGYICITEMPEALLAPPNPLPATGPPVQTMSVQTTPVQTTIDRDERILSDLSQALFTE
jgi:hypothetical protein